ncbi:hypothetical protein PGB90_004746 [Kerria lacca]
MVALIEEGRSRRSVANEYHVSEKCVRNIYKRYLETGQYAHRPRTGRPRSTSAREDRNNTRIALRTPFAMASTISREVRSVLNAPISSRTVQRRLQAYGLRSCKPATGPVLSRQHKVARLNFERTYAMWTVTEWSRILFTDESRFSLQDPDGRVRVWRRRGERYNQQNFVQRSNFFGGSKMVWGGIQYDAKTELHICQRPSVNADIYITDILQDHVMPFAPFVGAEFILQQDNARPHVAASTKAFLGEVGIRTMNWPACSPDLNPIEHVWDMLGRRLRNRNLQPNSLLELSNALIEEWGTIAQDDIRSLIQSMPERCSAVIAARGGNTKY